MFSKFTSILQSAVEALAPNLPNQQNFVGHWKAITHYFIQNKEHKVAIEQTVIPDHLESMLRILLEEEQDAETGATGPCMEYLLQHKILETLYTLARTDCPPGMKQQVLTFFTSLLSKVGQPLLPHVNVHKAVHRLVRVCGEVKAAPSENEEIQFLCTVCAKVKTDPYLVNFFIEIPKPMPNAADGGKRAVPHFAIVNSLLSLMHSADARVAVKACEGLMLCASIPEDSSATCIVKHTDFCTEMTNQLCSLYSRLPKAMDPADVECVEAKWGLDVMSDMEDRLNFAGKRSLVSFLSWLDYCDQLIQIAHPDVARALAEAITISFLRAVLEPAILQTSEAGATTATAHLCRCLRLVMSPVLLSEFVVFILGEDRSPETPGGQDTNHKLRQRLIERCDHLSEEMSITSLKLFEVLLLKPSEHVIHNLVLRNLLNGGYLPEEECKLRENPVNVTVDTDQKDIAKCEQRELPDPSSADCDKLETEESSTSKNVLKEVETDCPTESLGKEGDEDMQDEIHGVEEAIGDLTPPPSPHHTPNVHTVVNSFLCLVPDEAKSSYQTADSEYDTYLRDARRQFSDVCSQCRGWGWPSDPVCITDSNSTAFYEGSFMAVLLDKLSRMLDQSYDVNLQVTCIVSKLAMMPHPNLHEYLLNPLLTTSNQARTLTSVIKKVVHDVEQRMKQTEDFQRKLSQVRKQLMGMADNIRRAKASQTNSCVDNNHLLEGVIVLEEFCKELAAIACVKYYAVDAL